ncbi:hypothetical protein [Clostridium sp.]|uniref:hypothetical protein n=1 Tax=Clostridium sp. TaxID=1506 RepID=UPI001B4B96E1|nr:hypothetical protein [Clostridium sp.]MBP3915726.1 hypothetical protein [Clostridium sp.]
MYNEINKKLEKLKEFIKLKKSLKEEVNILEDQLEKDEKKLYDLEKDLKKEKKDVDNLNKFSVSNIIATVLNNKENKLEKEEQEYLIVKSKYDELLANINILKKDLVSKRNKLKTLDNCEEEYNKVINEKIKLIKDYGSYDAKEKILNLDKRINNIINESRKIKEVYEVGKKLIREVSYAKDELKNAKNWGILDIVGGDMMSSIVKHNKIKKANDKFYKIKELISSFNKELGDIKLNNISFSTITVTLDLFLDNIFTDISVQNKINDALNSIEEVKIKVERVMNELQRRYDSLEIELKEKKKEFNLLIEAL